MGIIKAPVAYLLSDPKVTCKPRLHPQPVKRPIWPAIVQPRLLTLYGTALHFFTLTFLYTFGFLLRFVATLQTVHFGSEADEFHRRFGASFGFHFTQDTTCIDLKNIQKQRWQFWEEMYWK